MAQITVPRFFPQPWAANELMTPLTPEEMAIGYPSGTSEKPSRQSINGVLQYAINGVLYYLTTGVPAWLLDAEYSVGSIVVFGGGYFYSTTDANIGQTPDALAGWERLPWRRGDLDALYMTQAQADARYLSPESGDLRYYTQVAANALFLTQANAAVQFVTKAALEANFLTKEQAEALYLTQAQADQRYTLRGDAVSRTALATTLADYETRESAAATFMTPEQAGERFMTTEEASGIFETQVDARATFLALQDAGLTIFRMSAVYGVGALVLETRSGIIYQSVVEDNTGNSLLNLEFWRPWVTPLPTDVNGQFLHCIEYGEYGDFVVNAEEIPLLVDHPDGIFLRVVLKGSGGDGGVSTTVFGQGGGEGETVEAILQGVTAAMFPMDVYITQHATTWIRLAGNDHLTVTAEPGRDGNTLVPGAGGAGEYLRPEIAPYVVSNLHTPGNSGKWGVPSLRGGDGGGAQGGSGTIAAQPISFGAGIRGCGGGGGTGNSAIVGGPGYVQIFW